MRASRRYWRQEPDSAEDLPEQVSRDGNLRHLQDQPSLTSVRATGPGALRIEHADGAAEELRLSATGYSWKRLDAAGTGSAAERRPTTE